MGVPRPISSKARLMAMALLVVALVASQLSFGAPAGAGFSQAPVPTIDDPTVDGSSSAQPSSPGPPVGGVVGTGSISGTLVDAFAAPIADATVWASGPSYGTATTAVDGTYTVPDLAAGWYQVNFGGPEGAGYAPEFYDDSYTTSTPVYVVDAVDTPGIDADLADGAMITGTVTDEYGTPVEGAAVRIGQFFWGSGLGGADVETGADGAYTATGLPPGYYRVQFYPPAGSNLLGEYYDNTYDYAAAMPVEAPLGTLVDLIDAELVEGGSISGTVTDGSGAPVADVYLQVDGAICCSRGASAQTAGDGTYTVVGLAAGDYQVRFYPSGGPLLPEFYDDAFSADDATLVPVATGVDTPGIDAELNEGGSISGSLTGPDDKPLAGVWARALREGSPVGTGQVADDGSYTIPGLSPGDYQVSFPTSYGTQYYDRAYRGSDATDVAVAVATDTPGIDGAINEIMVGQTFVANDTMLSLYCVAYDPGRFFFEVYSFDGSDGTTEGTLDFGDDSDPWIFTEKGSSTVRTFKWDSGLATPPTLDLTLTLTGGPANEATFGIVPGWTPCMPSVQTFTDVPVSHTFFSEIQWLVELDLTTGYPDGTFRPGADITRQAVVAWLWRLSGSPEPAGDSTFVDVAPGDPFAKAIAWAEETGLAEGFAGNEFRPGADITRQAAAAWIWRLAGSPEPAGDPTFSDVTPGQPFAKAIAWMEESLITEGFSDGTFRPGALITRQAVAAWICRVADTFPELVVPPAV